MPPMLAELKRCYAKRSQDLEKAAESIHWFLFSVGLMTIFGAVFIANVILNPSCLLLMLVTHAS